MKIPDAKESQCHYSKLAMFQSLLSSLHFEMHGIKCELHVAEMIKKTKLYKNDTVASTPCEVTARVVGSATKSCTRNFPRNQTAADTSTTRGKKSNLPHTWVCKVSSLPFQQEKWLVHSSSSSKPRFSF